MFRYCNRNWRSSTQEEYCILSGVPLIEKTRRTTIPLLCSRPGSACDKRIRKKSSCVSSEDVNQGTGARKISRKGCLSSEDIQIQMRKLSRMTPERDWVMSASLHHLGKTEPGLKRCFLFVLSKYCSKSTDKRSVFLSSKKCTVQIFIIHGALHKLYKLYNAGLSL